MTNGIPSQREIHSILFEVEPCIDFLLAKEIIYSSMECEKCEKPMKLQRNRRTFRCGTKNCRKEVSMFKSSFFSMCKLECCEILNLAYMWICGASHTILLALGDHSSATVCSFMSYFNQLVGNMVTDENCQIGGPGVEVEIDESKIAKRKYQRGHRVEGAWIIGGVERTEERKLFVVRVQDRTKQTISNLISRFVKPGSIILTDKWKSYDYLSKETQFTHHTVNHTLHFKDPDTQIHTNTIEGTWSGIKSKIPKRNRSGAFVDEHLLAFVWRRQNEDNLWEAFLEALKNTAFDE
jgi:IS1 family transposase